MGDTHQKTLLRGSNYVTFRLNVMWDKKKSMLKESEI